MPIIHKNDQNIVRLFTKMSEHFSAETRGKLSKLVEATNILERIKVNNSDNNSDIDHMYSTATENGEINFLDSNCQSAESEVKFWKEWLILHLDLIQQQSDEILSKDRTILILQQENEMLKERISCMERGAPYQPKKLFNNHSFEQELDMTQDSNVCDEDNKNCLDLLDLKCENESIIEPKSISDSESQTDSKLITASDSTANPMRNIKMNIRKKRLSNSSTVSNNEGSEEKRPFRRLKKRRKISGVLKDSQILTTTEHYITEAPRANLRLAKIPDVGLDIPANTTLEVPRWRIKVYASCYAMEGTENLDDEVYNKRHARLENDERRRKRWDVQRIREQRMIEKLKQRQERMGSGSRTDEQEPLQSLLPSLDDIKSLEVSEQLPVSAFGSPIPKIIPCEFTLPWLSNPSSVITKKVPARRVRRKTAKR